MRVVTCPVQRLPPLQPVGLPLPRPSGPQGPTSRAEPYVRAVAPLGTSCEPLEYYVSWREECHAVRLAYQRWVDSTRCEARLAYAGFVAALDREEHAARAYASHIERFSWISE